MESVGEAIRITLGPSGQEQLEIRSQPVTTGLLPSATLSRRDPILELIPGPVRHLVLVVHRHILRVRDQATADAALAAMCKALRPHKALGRKQVLPDGDLFIMRLFQLNNVPYPEISTFLRGRYTPDQIRQAIRQYFGRRAKSRR